MLEKTMNQIIKIVRRNISTLCIGFIITGLCFGTGHAEVIDRIVAMVNEDVIMLSEFKKAMSIIEKGLEERGYSIDQRRRILESQRDKLLEQLIYDKLTDQQVEQYKLKVDEDDVVATIDRISKANRISKEELLRSLELDGLTFEEYKKEIEKKMLRARLVNLKVKSKIVITDQDIKNYYDANLEKYRGSIKYDLSYIFLNIPEGADQKVRADIFKQINLIHDRLKTGGSFEKIARQFSESDNASQGGRLGVFGFNLLTDEIKKAIKGLQAKQFSPVVESSQGYQIFYVNKIIDTGGTSLEDATPQIHEKLYADVIDEKFNKWIEDLRKRSHIQIISE